MKKDSKENQAKYVELNLFPEEIEDHQKDSVSSDSKENHTSSDKEYDLTDLFERLSGSAFRSRFHLSKKDKEYIAEKGLATILHDSLRTARQPWHREGRRNVA